MADKSIKFQDFHATRFGRKIRQRNNLCASNYNINVTFCNWQQSNYQLLVTCTDIRDISAVKFEFSLLKLHF
jgi:hypothetical protein